MGVDGVDTDGGGGGAATDGGAGVGSAASSVAAATVGMSADAGVAGVLITSVSGVILASTGAAPILCALVS